MESGCNDDDYALVYRAVVVPVLDQFAPELLLVSAGFDAHERDPLASMRMTTEGFGAMVQELSDVAARHGGLAMVTEGGYDLPALAACLERSVGVLSGGSPGLRRTVSNGARGARAVAGAREFLKPFWSVL
jgi:acetoin utilization deacetylase AcuC-like enzyme